MLRHHADGTPQGLQVFWGQADLPTRRKMSREYVAGLSESPEVDDLLSHARLADWKARR